MAIRTVKAPATPAKKVTLKAATKAAKSVKSTKKKA